MSVAPLTTSLTLEGGFTLYALVFANGDLNDGACRPGRAGRA